jgi:hypothetical protein
VRPVPFAILLSTLAVAARAQAQLPSPNPNAPSLPGSPGAEEDPAATGSEAPSYGAEEGPLAEAPEQRRLTLLEQEVAELRDRLQKAEDERQNDVSPLSVTGYVDLGFFAPLGNNGVGWVRDVGNRQFPDYSNYAWTFLGDILGTPVNSRGEAADLGQAPGVDRFDSVDSDGAPGFIVNEVNLTLGYTLADDAIMRASVNFVPRSAAQDFAIGDFLELDLAELEYVLTDDGRTSLFIGKILPVFGIEYKDRKSDQRFGITPSLIARYTTGPQLGAKIRSRLFDEWLILAASVTNNTSTVEQFELYREIDRNVGKTLNGRAALSVPLSGWAALEGDRLELGVSGEWGAQDHDTRSDREIWLVGADLQYQSTNFALKAQIITGEAPGTIDETVWALDLSPSGYVELDWQAHARLGLLLRAEMRDALVSLGSERVYVTDQARLTGGLRWLFNPHVIAKAEYYHNQELGNIEQFANDMFTSSLLLVY